MVSQEVGKKKLARTTGDRRGGSGKDIHKGGHVPSHSKLGQEQPTASTKIDIDHSETNLLYSKETILSSSSCAILYGRDLEDSSNPERSSHRIDSSH